MKKKDLPLNVLKALEPFVNLHGKVFTITDHDKRLLTVVDKDENSTFCFYISGYEQKDSKYYFNVAYAPFNEHHPTLAQKRVTGEHLQEVFNNWVNLLEQYSSVKSFFDDPILKTYEAEFISNFEFLEDEADVHPFRTTQILQLDYILEHMSSRLIEMSDETNIDQINEINSEIDLLRENLTTRSKKWVLEKFSKIYGKVAKQGTTFLKEFWVEGKKEVIKNIVKGIIESGTDLLG